MTDGVLLFVALPYVALTLAIVGSVYRLRYRKFSVSSLSTQLLENRQLFWGSVSFHWGIVAILTGHLLVLLVPVGFQAWNGSPVRLYLLEITGFALGIWALGGLVVLAHRRLTSRRVRVVTTRMDFVVLTLIFAQIVTGLWIAAGYRWGSFWGTGVFAPWIWSLLTLRPRPELVANLPLVLQTHVTLFWLFLVVFPFTRLVHIITVPFQYLLRPWQLVRWVRRERTAPKQEVPARVGTGV
ncbi:MAG TPA: respiratory nitrate reductase subunit gamma [Acidimicrobiia bacterium]|nr:respiratory nitrate reductase subunit gamma [Acidimicrobiia bacterium]